jgi:hypothetical protein
MFDTNNFFGLLEKLGLSHRLSLYLFLLFLIFGAKIGSIVKDGDLSALMKPSSLIFIGGVFILFAIADIQYPQLLKGYFPSFIGFGLGLTLVVWGLFQIFKLPEFPTLFLIVFSLWIFTFSIFFLRDQIWKVGSINIAVLEFTPISDDAKIDSKNFQDRLYHRLLDIRPGASDIQIKRFSENIKILETQQKREALCLRHYRGRAQIVVWGDIRIENGEAFIRPRVSLIKPIRSLDRGSMGIGELKGDIVSLDFKKATADNISAIVDEVLGINYYLNQKFNLALDHFNNSSTITSLYFAGLTHHDLAAQGVKFDHNISISKGIFNTIEKHHTSNPNALIAASIGLGNIALFESNHNNDIGFLKVSEQYYKNAINLCKIYNLTNENYGLALTNLATVVNEIAKYENDKNVAYAMVKNSIEIHSNGIEVLSKNKSYHHLIQAHLNLGNSFLSKKYYNPNEMNSCLSSARINFELAKEYAVKIKVSYFNNKINESFGNVYRDKGIEEESRKQLKRAVQFFEKSIKEIPDENTDDKFLKLSGEKFYTYYTLLLIDSKDTKSLSKAFDWFSSHENEIFNLDNLKTKGSLLKRYGMVSFKNGMATGNMNYVKKSSQLLTIAGECFGKIGDIHSQNHCKNLVVEAVKQLNEE